MLQTVAELGVVIFNALDFGLKEDEERQLSPALENMIDLMTSSGKISFKIISFRAFALVGNNRKGI
jgi:hypothetical protein